jgi:hypothetical protein
MSMSLLLPLLWLLQMTTTIHKVELFPKLVSRRRLFPPHPIVLSMLLVSTSPLVLFVTASGFYSVSVEWKIP